MAFFWPSSWFESPSSAAAALFSLLNGDSLLDSYNELGNISSFAHIYLYSFLCLFIYVILNVNISVIVQAYSTTLDEKRQKKLNLEGMSTRALRRRHVFEAFRTAFPEEGVMLEDSLYRSG